MICARCYEDFPDEMFAKEASSLTGRQAYCRACHRECVRAWRARNLGAETERYRKEPDFRKKVRARQRMLRRLERGALVRGLCEVCGAANAQFHHDDYNQPTVIRWLCLKCHGAHHYPEAQAAQVAAKRLEAICRKHVARYDAKHQKAG